MRYFWDKFTYFIFGSTFSTFGNLLYAMSLNDAFNYNCFKATIASIGGLVIGYAISLCFIALRHLALRNFISYFIF